MDLRLIKTNVWGLEAAPSALEGPNLPFSSDIIGLASGQGDWMLPSPSSPKVAKIPRTSNRRWFPTRQSPGQGWRLVQKAARRRRGHLCHLPYPLTLPFMHSVTSLSVYGAYQRRVETEISEFTVRFGRWPS